jgi:hypothetical protein
MDNTRTDQTSGDPNYRWSGPSTDIRRKPTPYQLDLQRAAARQNPAPVEHHTKMVATARDLVYAIGLPAASEDFVRRVLELEHQNKLLADRLERLEMDFAQKEVQI